MKKLMFCLSLVVASYSVSLATVRTLCNMPYSPGQFTTFLAAHDASSSGDTIYVHGSSFSYGDISIHTPLVIIGTGHNPAKQMALVSEFGRITIQSNAVQLIGLKFRSLNSQGGYLNGVVKKCIVGNPLESNATIFLYFGSNWLIEGNIIENYNAPALDFTNTSADGTIIRNNVFSGPVYPMLYNLFNQTGENTYFLNNIVLGNSTLGTTSISNVINLHIRNNIFYGSSPSDFSLVTCTMNNNISFQCQDNSFLSPGNNNLVDVDPMFVNYTQVGNPSPGSYFNYTYDFQLASGSPGKNNGTDGTDRGVYGGVGSLFTMTGEPPIAEITTFTITSPTVIPPGGNLTISVGSKRVH
jgi:hypothetical protein